MRFVEVPWAEGESSLRFSKLWFIDFRGFGKVLICVDSTLQRSRSELKKFLRPSKNLLVLPVTGKNSHKINVLKKRAVSI